MKSEKKHFQRIKEYLGSLSLSKKIIYLAGLACLVPMAVILLLSIREMQISQEEQQMFSLNQGYNQTRQALEDKMTRLHNISTMLALDDTVNLNLKLSNSDESLARQILAFENLDSYTYGMEMAFESSSILFYIDEKVPVVNNISGRYRSLETAKQMTWYDTLEGNGGRPTWVSFSEDRYDRSRSYVAIARELWDPDDFNVSIGVLAVLVERKSLEEILLNTVKGQIIYLEAEDGSILASNVGEEELNRLPKGQRNIETEDFRTMTIDQESFLIRSQMVDATNAYLISMIPVSVMKEELTGINVRVWLMYLMASLLVLCAMIPLTKSVTKRLYLLKEQMLQIQEKGELPKIALEQPGTDEIGQLITHYNQMTDRVGELMEKQYELGKEKMEAELKALQSQINPHFLYNTLDMINWMARKNETEYICNAVQAMSRFYRMTLSGGRDIVTIADEIRMCEAYMEIQQQRYRGRIFYETNIDEEILPYAIPKITLQPFLENAIIHGIIEKEDARGTVSLTGWLEDGRIYLSIMDDGKGMQPEEAGRKTSGSHYGMKNIASRLKLFYEEEIPIEIESSCGVGTCIIINLPMKRIESV